MSTFEIQMPKMGESVEEATITKWFVKEGDKVEEDDPILEIATDKVDSEIPSPVAGTVKEIKFATDELVAVGKTVAIIDLDSEEETDDEDQNQQEKEEKEEQKDKPEEATETTKEETKKSTKETSKMGKSEDDQKQSDRFYSPLVLNIAKEEGVSFKELDSISGSGKEGRVTKNDILNYIESSSKDESPKERSADTKQSDSPTAAPQQKQAPKVTVGEGDEVVEMDRLRKLIADNMVMSKQVSAHVTSVVEADVTNLVLWRNKVKDQFQEKHKEKLTFMPVFAEAVAKALRDFPQVNSSVNGHDIILRKNVNIGIAVALPSGNLIVPVIKQADQKNMVGLASDINHLAQAARSNKLSTDDIQGGTFTITNFGSFRNTIGTPIINQPQVAILVADL